MSNITTKTIDTTVTFTKRQLAYLERVFGEYPGNPKMSVAELRYNSGVRAVVHHIRSKVRDD